MKECYLYKKLKNNNVLCQTCGHFCALSNKEKGKCGVKKNINGKLYSLNYNKVTALCADPIEKKPFYHFYPGTLSLSVGLPGCSFFCKNCQNWSISQRPKKSNYIEGKNISPEEIIKIAKKNNFPSISYTYSDPLAFFEYTIDTMKLAKKENIKNCLVTHGFMTKKSLTSFLPYLDAVNIDIKSFSKNFYKKICQSQIEPVLKSAIILKKKKIWVEITTLIIPELSDSRKTLQSISSFISKKLGNETPWHISRFYPEISWKLKHLKETSQTTLESAYQIGKDNKLKYIYIGNSKEDKFQNTHCSNCNSNVINRSFYSIYRYDKNGKCNKCSTSINIIN